MGIGFLVAFYCRACSESVSFGLARSSDASSQGLFKLTEIAARVGVGLWALLVHSTYQYLVSPRPWFWQVLNTKAHVTPCRIFKGLTGHGYILLLYVGPPPSRGSRWGRPVEVWMNATILK